MILRQVLLVIAAAALGAAALRTGDWIFALGTGAGPEDAPLVDRLLVAAPLAAGAAVLWTLLAGLVGLGTAPAVLACGPLVWWLTMRTLALGGHPLAGPALARLVAARRAKRVVAVTLAGVAAACVFDIVFAPGFDIDALAYHLPDVVGWLHTGHPGAVQTFSYDYPVGYYPLTSEVLLTWILGISRTFAPLALWSPALLGLGLLALWRLLARLGVPRFASALAVAAVAVLPTLVVGINLNDPGTDLPAAAWLGCAAALSLAAAERPALLGVAFLAAGIGVGTKTTVAPLAVIALAFGAWRARAALRPAAPVLIGGVVAAALVGGPWYVRNWVSHGWPLWPFASGPTGQPLPHAMSLFRASFLDRPAATIRGLGWHSYSTVLAGGLVLVTGVAAVPLLTRTRAALVAAAVAILALLVWASAPFTGFPHDRLLGLLTLSTLRYMFPALAACAVALAVAARDARPAARMVPLGVLAGSIVFSLVSDARIGPASAVPRLSYLLVGAGAGALVGATLPARLPPRPRSRLARLTGPLLVCVVGVLAAAFLALGARHWLNRESRQAAYQAPLLAFMLRQPGFAAGSQPVSFAPSVVATLAGSYFRHPLELIPAREPCADVQRRLRGGWIVVFPRMYAAGITTAFDAPACLRAITPAYDDGATIVYRPLA